jgi:hypothetical protein
MHAFVEFAKPKDFEFVLDYTSCESPAKLNGITLRNSNVSNCDEGNIINPLVLYGLKFSPEY